jgi:hypothetical protein
LQELAEGCIKTPAEMVTDQPNIGVLPGGGPLPQAWLDQQLQLQIKILSRMRDLGMTPGMLLPDPTP